MENKKVLILEVGPFRSSLFLKPYRIRRQRKPVNILMAALSSINSKKKIHQNGRNNIKVRLLLYTFIYVTYYDTLYLYKYNKVHYILSSVVFCAATCILCEISLLLQTHLHVEQVLPTFTEHLSSPSVFCGVRVCCWISIVCYIYKCI
jgi:hypothetical protein